MLAFCLGFAWKAPAQTTTGSNCNRTVTHKASGPAIDRTSGTESRQSNAQESRMPQKTKYTDMNTAKYVQSSVNQTLRSINASGTPTGLPKDFHYDMNLWTQKDVTEFAKCANTFDGFECLLGIANTAVEIDKAGHYTKDAHDAQAALEAIKPACCKSWVGFGKMITKAADESQAIRDKYHADIEARKHGKHSSVIELHKDVKYAGELSKGEDPKVQALAAVANLKTALQVA